MPSILPDSNQTLVSPKKPSLFDRFKSIFKKNRTSSSSALTSKDISSPSNYRHLAHIGFDSENGAFNIKNIPPEWKKMFEKAGVTEGQLKNPETARFIAKFVGNQQQSEKGKRVPPPVPSRPRKPAYTPTAPTISAREKTVQDTVEPVHTSTNPSFANDKQRPTISPPPPPAPPIPKSNTSVEKVNNQNTASPPPPPPAPAPTIKKQQSSEEQDSAGPSIKASLPVIDDARSQLLSSIRKAGIGDLKKMKSNNKSSKATSMATKVASKVADDNESTDIMAAMLAKALADRKKRVGANDSDNGD